MTSTPVICRVCDKSGDFPTFIAREMMTGSGETFTYVQCTDCKTLQIETIPAHLDQFYKSDYYSFRPVQESGLKYLLINRMLGIREASYVLKNKIIRSFFQATIPPVEHTRLVLDSLAFAGANKATALLDVGCGNGTILHRLREGGFKDVSGVDPFVTTDIHYRNGLTVEKTRLSSLKRTFDLITFHHSFEHLDKPLAALLNAKSLLRKEGKILIRIPTVSSDVWDEYGTDWFQLDAPRHLYLFSRKAMTILAEKAGLQIIGSYDDSTAIQFLASEQYRRGIALDAPNSYLVSKKAAPFSQADVNSFKQKAASLNKVQRGDQLVLLLTTSTP